MGRRFDESLASVYGANIDGHQFGAPSDLQRDLDTRLPNRPDMAIKISKILDPLPCYGHK
jgi:hypothetical protein